MSKIDEDAYEVNNIIDIINQSEGRFSDEDLPPEVVEEVNQLPGVKVSSPVEIDKNGNPRDAEASISIMKQHFLDYYKANNIQWDVDLDDTFRILNQLSDPKKFKLFMLGLNNEVDKIRAVVLSRMLVSLLVSSHKLTDPSFLNSLNPVDAVGFNDRLLSQMKEITKLKSMLKIKDPEAEMAQLLADQSRSSNLDEKDKSKILQLLDEL